MTDNERKKGWRMRQKQQERELERREREREGETETGRERESYAIQTFAENRQLFTAMFRLIMS